MNWVIVIIGISMIILSLVIKSKKTNRTLIQDLLLKLRKIGNNLK